MCADNHYLRISIPAKFFGGKRVFLYCNMEDTVGNVVAAQEVADAMNADIAARCFDLSLDRYKRMVSTDEIVQQNHDNFDGSIPGVHARKLATLWRRWVPHLLLSEETYNNKYRWVERYIQLYDPDWDSTDWTNEITTGASTFNAYMSYVRRCVEWALDEGLIKGRNPYKNISRSTKGQTKKRKGFNTKEKLKILAEFKNPTHPDPEQRDRIQWHYLMVLFWFLTGLRVGEVSGIKWVDILWDEGQVVVRRSQSRDHSNAGKGHRLKEKSTKTGVVRVLDMNESVREVLMQAQARAIAGSDLVFPSQSGAVIDMGNWRRRVWYGVLDRAGVSHQPPKNVRHTLLTEAAKDPTIGVVGAAKIAGHTTTRPVQDNYIDVTGVAQLPSGDRP